MVSSQSKRTNSTSPVFLSGLNFPQSVVRTLSSSSSQNPCVHARKAVEKGCCHGNDYQRPEPSRGRRCCHRESELTATPRTRLRIFASPPRADCDQSREKNDVDRTCDPSVDADVIQGIRLAANLRAATQGFVASNNQIAVAPTISPENNPPTQHRIASAPKFDACAGEETTRDCSFAIAGRRQLDVRATNQWPHGLSNRSM